MAWPGGGQSLPGGDRDAGDTAPGMVQEEQSMSLAKTTKEINCRLLRAEPTEEGWRIYCRGDGKPAGAVRCGRCGKKQKIM